MLILIVHLVVFASIIYVFAIMDIICKKMMFSWIIFKFINIIYRVENKCNKCPFGWLYNDGYCYYVSQDKLNWTSAASYCLQNNANLVNLDKNDISSYPVRLFKFVDSLDINQPLWVKKFVSSKIIKLFFS